MVVALAAGTARVLFREPSAPATATEAAALVTELGPVWIDSVLRDRVRDWVTSARTSDLSNDARAAYVCGALALGEDRPDEAQHWFLRSRSLVDADDPLLVGRLALELGSLHLGRGEPEVAWTTLAWAEALVGRASSERLADLSHLRGLLADSRGDYTQAALGFRSAISTWTAALTPATSVYAHGHLAVAMSHQDSAASVAMCQEALSLVESERLHPRVATAIRNVLGYALICRGQLQEARSMLTQAADEARTFSNGRVELYARFNLAIVNELAGRSDVARRELEAVATTSALRHVDALVPWAHIRIAWLSLQQGTAADARALLRRALPRVSENYADAIDTLTALIALQLGEASTARRLLVQCGARAAQRGDRLTEVVLLLWIAHLEHQGGRPLAGRRALRRAGELARASDFRLSPNWWSPDLVTSAQALTQDADRAFVERLIAPSRTCTPARQPVVVAKDGLVLIDGHALPMDAWREGRSGSKLLQRLFVAIVRAGTHGISREELCDLLWPESDGDRAVRNLYAATHDLRRVLCGIPGTRLITTSGRYRLEFESNVLVESVGQAPIPVSRRSDPRAGSTFGPKLSV